MNEVGDFMQKLDPPFKVELEALRALLPKARIAVVNALIRKAWARKVPKRLVALIGCESVP